MVLGTNHDTCWVPLFGLRGLVCDFSRGRSEQTSLTLNNRPKFSLVNIVSSLLGSLRGTRVIQRQPNCQKAHPTMGDKSQKLYIWSPLPNMQASPPGASSPQQRHAATGSHTEGFAYLILFPKALRTCEFLEPSEPCPKPPIVFLGLMRTPASRRDYFNLEQRAAHTNSTNECMTNPC